MRHVHIGIRGNGETHPSLHRQRPGFLPDGFITDGDSFLEWGEGRYGQHEHDDTLHVVVRVPEVGALPGREGKRVEDLRDDLSQYLQPGERLYDYVVVTDAEDWGKNQRIWLSDGTITPEENA